MPVHGAHSDRHTCVLRKVAPVLRRTRKNIVDLLIAIVVVMLIVGMGALLLARALGW